MVPIGEQRRLHSTNLDGMVQIDPRKDDDDFFIRVIEQKSRFKRENKPLADFLKVLGNSGSYGLFVQVDPETKAKAAKVRVHSGEKSFSMSSEYIEKPGLVFPSGCVSDYLRWAVAFGNARTMRPKCSRKLPFLRHRFKMCIVASKRGGLVPCVGGKRKLHGKDAIKALSFRQVESIANRFTRLNPYDPNLVREIVKIEDVNFVDSDPSKPQRQLFGYGIAAKRYALYTRGRNSISIVKASGHGLGYLFAPKKRDSDDKDEAEENDKVPAWVTEAWDWLLRKELRLRSKEPTWLSLPAMMRMTMTSPNVMRNNRPEWLSPFNFFLFPLISDLGGYPAEFERSNFGVILGLSYRLNRTVLDGRALQASTCGMKKSTEFRCIPTKIEPL
jgi:hypothetical protein